MNLFGGSNPPSWFLGEVRTECIRLAKEPHANPTSALLEFIVRQAAKYDLDMVSIEADINKLGMPPALSDLIKGAFIESKSHVRAAITNHTSVESIHHTVGDSEIIYDDGVPRIRATLNGLEMAEIDISKCSSDLTNSLQSALQCFDNYS